MSNYLTSMARRAAGMAPSHSHGVSALVVPKPVPRWASVVGAEKGQAAAPMLVEGEALLTSTRTSANENLLHEGRERSEISAGMTSGIRSAISDSLPQAATDGDSQGGQITRGIAREQTPLAGPKSSTRSVRFPFQEQVLPQAVNPRVDSAPEIPPRAPENRSEPEDPPVAKVSARLAAGNKDKNKDAFQVASLEDILLPAQTTRVPEAMLRREPGPSLHSSELQARILPVLVEDSASRKTASSALQTNSSEADGRLVEEHKPQAQAVLHPPAAVWSDANAMEAKEQQVTVHIGVIEIRTPERTQPAEHPVSQAPPAPMPAGFDSFARLRVYAPWTL